MHAEIPGTCACTNADQCGLSVCVVLGSSRPVQIGKSPRSGLAPHLSNGENTEENRVKELCVAPFLRVRRSHYITHQRQQLSYLIRCNLRLCRTSVKPRLQHAPHAHYRILVPASETALRDSRRRIDLRDSPAFQPSPIVELLRVAAPKSPRSRASLEAVLPRSLARCS
jgi:hypothetical protein